MNCKDELMLLLVGFLAMVAVIVTLSGCVAIPISIDGGSAGVSGPVTVHTEILKNNQLPVASPGN